MLYNQLVNKLGIDKVKKDSNTLLAYSYDASMEEGHPKIVVFPNSEKDIIEVVKIANDSFVDVIVRGGGTGLCGSVVPKNNSLILDISRMNNIIKQEEDIVYVEPGVILDDLNEFLKQKGLFLPVIPSSHSVCTISGMVACNSAGKRAIKYGKMQNWVEYLEIIDGIGRKRKINDVKKFLGSEGILGIITLIKLRLVKIPEKTTLELYKTDTPSEAISIVKREKNNIHILSMELLNPIISEYLGMEKRFHLIIEYDDNKGSIRDIEKIKELNLFRDNAYTVSASKGYTLIQDPLFSESTKLEAFLDYLEKEQIPYFGHIGIGVIHPCLKTEKQVKELYNIVKKLKGSLTGEHGIGLTKKEYLSEEIKNKFKFYKKQYDPNNILNRGKII